MKYMRKAGEGGNGVAPKSAFHARSRDATWERGKRVKNVGSVYDSRRILEAQATTAPACLVTQDEDEGIYS